MIQIKLKNGTFEVCTLDELARARYKSADGQHFLTVQGKIHNEEITTDELQNIKNKLVAAGVSFLVHEAFGFITQG